MTCLLLRVAVLTKKEQVNLDLIQSKSRHQMEALFNLTGPTVTSSTGVRGKGIKVEKEEEGGFVEEDGLGQQAMFFSPVIDKGVRKNGIWP